MSSLLFNAFRALGSGATRREIAMVAEALRESGDREAQRLLEADDLEPLNKIAHATGAFGFVALDLVMAYRNPQGFAELVGYEQRSTGLAAPTAGQAHAQPDLTAASASMRHSASPSRQEISSSSPGVP